MSRHPLLLALPLQAKSSWMVCSKDIMYAYSADRFVIILANSAIVAAGYRADIEMLVKAIRSMTQCTPEAFLDPAKLLNVPFPSTQALPSRFALDEHGSFQFMGREKFRELHEHASQLQRPAETLSLIGTMGFGKSHTLVVLAVLPLRQHWDGFLSMRVVYVADCTSRIRFAHGRRRTCVCP